MNHDLIKQLELAIAVERGEVPGEDIQYRVRPELKNVYNTGRDWSCIPTIHTPKYWNHEQYEYRRKPKPLELWVNIREDGLMRCFDCVQGALADAKSRASNDEMPERSVAVHMREVTNE